MKVSVITINYNNATGLKRTIESVIKQTYKNIEYIVIDGGSIDKSVAVINEYQSRIKYSVSEKDKGVYNAQNKGINAATGDYLLFLNSGDYLENDHAIESLIAGNNNEDLIYGDLKRIFPDGSTDVVKMPDVIGIERFLHHTLCHPVTLIKKCLFNQFGLYDEQIKIVADWAFFLKVFVQGKPVYKHKDVVVSVFYMDGMSSQESNQELILAERERVVSEYISPAVLDVIKEKEKYKSIVRRYKVDRLHSLLKFIKNKILFSKSMQKLVIH